MHPVLKYDDAHGVLSKFIELLPYSWLGFFFLLLMVVQDYCGAILEQGQIQKPPELQQIFVVVVKACESYSHETTIWLV